MNFHKRGAITLGLALVLAQSCTHEKKQEAEASPPSGSGPLGTTNQKVADKNDTVEQGALDALKGMSNYLMTAKTLEIDSDGTLDAVTQSGQRIQLDGTTNYKIRRPGFVIDYESDIKSRRFIYDGKTFTIASPKLGFFATAAAPPTNREALDTIYDKFGIRLPLEDLFRWSDATRAERLQGFESAYYVGVTTLDGVKTDQFAFREPGVDWQVWIDQGDKPLPRKLVIIDRKEPSKPTFTAHLKWKVNPNFADSVFAFKPGADDKKIALATFTDRGE